MLSYAVYARERQLLRVRVCETNDSLFENESQLHDWAREDEWLKLSFEQIHVLWNDPRYLPVPEEFAEAGNAGALSAHQFDISPQEMLRYSDCGMVKLLYALNEKAYYAARSRFPEARHEHTAGRILNWFMDPNIDQNLLVVDYQDSVQFMVREGDKLQFCQSFPYSNPNEAAYLVLNSMEKLAIKRESATLLTLGISSDSPLFTLLDTYVRKVQGVKLPLPEALKDEFALHPLLIALL